MLALREREREKREGWTIGCIADGTNGAGKGGKCTKLEEAPRSPGRGCGRGGRRGGGRGGGGRRRGCLVVEQGLQWRFGRHRGDGAERPGDLVSGDDGREIGEEVSRSEEDSGHGVFEGFGGRNPNKVGVFNYSNKRR